MKKIILNLLLAFTASMCVAQKITIDTDSMSIMDNIKRVDTTVFVFRLVENPSVFEMPPMPNDSEKVKVKQMTLKVEVKAYGLTAWKNMQSVLKKQEVDSNESVKALVRQRKEMLDAVDEKIRRRKEEINQVRNTKN